MKPRLLAISGSLTGSVQLLVDGQLSIGREESNQLCLVDPVVSRRHCTIQQTGLQFELIDLDSHNGTFVNGIPIRRRNIDHGDTIRIGSSELVFLTHEGEVFPNAGTRRAYGSFNPTLTTTSHRKCTTGSGIRSRGWANGA